MAHPYHHAVRSAKLFGGEPDDYLKIHEWFDESKAHIGDFRHRALRHHSEGIFLCAAIFGATIKTSGGKRIPVRSIGEQHVTDDLGWIPSVKDWLQHIQIQPWMGRTPFRPQTDANSPDHRLNEDQASATKNEGRIAKQDDKSSGFEPKRQTPLTYLYNLFQPRRS